MTGETRMAPGEGSCISIPRMNLLESLSFLCLAWRNFLQLHFFVYALGWPAFGAESPIPSLSGTADRPCLCNRFYALVSLCRNLPRVLVQQSRRHSLLRRCRCWVSGKKCDCCKLEDNYQRIILNRD